MSEVSNWLLIMHVREVLLINVKRHTNAHLLSTFLLNMGIYPSLFSVLDKFWLLKLHTSEYNLKTRLHGWGVCDLSKVFAEPKALKCSVEVDGIPVLTWLVTVTWYTRTMTKFPYCPIPLFLQRLSLSSRRVVCGRVTEGLITAE